MLPFDFEAHYHLLFLKQQPASLWFSGHSLEYSKNSIIP